MTVLNVVRLEARRSEACALLLLLFSPAVFSANPVRAAQEATKAASPAQKAAISAQTAAVAAEKAASSVAGIEKKLNDAAKDGVFFPIVGVRPVLYERWGRGLFKKGTSLRSSVYCDTADRPVQSGDALKLDVNAAQYDAARKTHTSDPLLFVNGISLGPDAKFRLLDKIGDIQTVRFELGSGKSSQELWTSVYRENGVAVETPVNVAMGWDNKQVFTQTEPGADSKPVRVSVSSTVADWFAFVLGGLFVLIFWVCLAFTPLFRDSTAPPFWANAKTLRRLILDEVYKVVKTKRLRWLKPVNWNDSTHQAAALAVIQLIYPSFVYLNDSESKNQFPLLVDQAVRELLPADDAVINTTVALAVSDPRCKCPRLAYSLARVQSALWLLFALITTTFLWVAFGDFPPLGGSIAALIAVSVITTGASVSVDKNSGAPSPYSNGFFNDLLTGPLNGVAQPHRFQSVMVNIFLLCAGASYVVQYLWFPTFDSSWLALLGISGAALVAGKQTLETPKT